MDKTPEELKIEAEAQAAANAQAAKKLEEEMGLGGDESVDSLKAELAKVRSERDNYKTGLLSLKKSKKEGGEENDEDEEEDDDNVKNIETIAVRAATGLMEKTNEQSAISQFKERYPALKDPSTWAKVVENYTNRAGKGSVDSIKQDLEAALILAKHYGGGKVAEQEITLNQFAQVSHAGSIAPHEAVSDLKDSTIEMGERFGNSAEQLKEASLPGANEIKLA